MGHFLQEKIGNFFEGLYNFLLFFPYFFSVTALFGSLFAPWKGITDTTKSRGFSFSDLMNRFMTNLISVGIGFVLRVGLISFFFVFQALYIILIPVIILLFFLSLPIQFFIYVIHPSHAAAKQQVKDHFVKTHCLTEQNRAFVEQWFESDYAMKQKKSEWWKLSILMNSVPLARDWTMGYTPTLDSYTTDITDPSYQNHIHHMVGRAKEIAQIEQALLKAEESNVLLIGEEDVGRHTIIDSFAQNIYNGHCNKLLAYRRVLKLHMEKIMARYTDPKTREDFLSQLLEEAGQSHNVILCIDNFDNYVSGGDASRVDFSEVLSEFGKTSKLQIIGITTPFDYEKYVYPNEQIRNIMTKVDVYEISKLEALQIVMDTNHILEQRYHVYIPFETLQTIVEKSDFFVTNIPFPEKALQLLEATCVYTVENLKQQVVMPPTVDTVLSERTHTPTTLNADLKQKLLSLDTELSKRVVNQDTAMNDLSAAMRHAFLLLGKRHKPLTSFLFLGPTGVGKTETAKALATLFFGSESFMVRFDMSQFQSKEDIPKLIGSAETKEPGLLTDAIRQHAYGILLLDEIEKGNRDLLNVFLTVLDEGYFTDGYGKRVDCKNLVIIATSNAGADFIFQKMKFGQPVPTPELMEHLVSTKVFSPEFLNRFDGVIAFNPLSGESMIPIARHMLESVQKQIFELYHVKLTVSDATLKTVLSKNQDPAFGARNLDRLLRTEIEDQVAKIILSGKAQPGSTIEM